MDALQNLNVLSTYYTLKINTVLGYIVKTYSLYKYHEKITDFNNYIDCLDVDGDKTFEYCKGFNACMALTGYTCHAISIDKYFYKLETILKRLCNTGRYNHACYFIAKILNTPTVAGINRAFYYYGMISAGSYDYIYNSKTGNFDKVNYTYDFT